MNDTLIVLMLPRNVFLSTVQKEYKIELIGDIMSPFQSQLTILQNAINNWHTPHDNFSDPHAETLRKLV